MFKLYLYGIEILRRQRIFNLLESSNCTFMELKYQTESIDKHLNNVQIVPLWN